MGISRDKWHKRRSTGAKCVPMRKKRKFELGRPAAMTKLGPKRIHEVRTMGGNKKFRALRLETGNFSWGSESVAKKCRIIGVVYNASNNELVRTNTLVKSAVVQIDAIPFRQYYEAHYGVAIGRKKGVEVEDDILEKKKSNHVMRKLKARHPMCKVDPHVESQFVAGRVYAIISSRPGQSGRADGYILEGKELDFYMKKMKTHKH